MFVSKAETLDFLSNVLKKAKVLPVFTLTKQQWQTSPSSCITSLLSHPSQSFPFVVRSSSFSEDTLTESAAGKYLSLLDIDTESSLIDAITQVFASYGSDLAPESQVLIQPQLVGIQRCGVVFTRDPNNGGFYYVVNYDESGDTQSVTSGYGDSQVVEYWLHGAENLKAKWRPQVVELLLELRAIFPDVDLDVEFAFDLQGNLYVFQVRPLIVTQAMQRETSLAEISAQIVQLGKKVQQLSKPHPHLLGEQAIFANMPDWNPAEMIGTRPKPLALSLYKTLITDETWAYQRHHYGYRDLRSFPLLVSLGNSPFINVRVSFNSFIPQSLQDSLAEKLVNYYLARLAEQPHLQDKVEFEIVLSSYSFDIKKRCKPLLDKGFSTDELGELVQALKVLTSRVIAPKNGLLAEDIQQLDTLQKRFEAVQHSDLNDIESIYWLIEDGKRYGTLPFAGIARAGFIAKQMLDSLVAESLLSETRAQAFLMSLHTVSGQFIADSKSMDEQRFFHTYGHLRPGTYDIESPRYDEMPELVRQRPAYLDTELSAWLTTESSPPQQPADFALTETERSAISDAIFAHQLPFDVDELFTFMRQAMEARERAKFLFTRNVSEVLKRLVTLGERKGFSRSSLAYLDINDVLSLYSSTQSTTQTFETSICKNKSYYDLCSAINLPPVLIHEADVFCFQLPRTQPNFVTLKTAFGEVCEDLSEVLTAKIVFIPAADPGFDWIFSHNIAGLVTMYGGVNSHMAIRAGELSIPAVIGAGEPLYERWKKASLLKLDCQAKQVELLYSSKDSSQSCE